MSLLFLLPILLAACHTESAEPQVISVPQVNPKLKPCPESPNCVSTTSDDSDQHLDPLSYTGTESEAQELLISVLKSIPRGEITHQQLGYLIARVRSRVFGFVDELEFLFDDSKKRIEFRSGAEEGYYDFGVNRRRMESIREKFLKLQDERGAKSEPS